MSTIANVEMAAAWDGQEGDRWTEQAERYEAAGRRQWQHLVDGGFITSTDRVLDIGCGTGSSTRDAARLAPSGSVLGLDLSARMLDLARRRSHAEGLENVAYEQGDAQVHPFPAATFDVAISSFGVMFFNDPPAAFANIAAALRPGGRLALLAWRTLDRNAWLTAFRQALAAGRDLPEPPVGRPGPLGLADDGQAGALLAGAGFDDIAFTSVDEPMYFGIDTDDAYAFACTMGIVEGLTHDLDEATRAATLDALRAMLASHDTPEGVLIASSAWLISARRP